MSHSRIRAFNKRYFNGLVHRFAGVSRTPFALIRHVGRRSGKPYETPIIVMPLGNSFVIALTYGPEVDWYRNVRAAGEATLLWHNSEMDLLPFVGIFSPARAKKYLQKKKSIALPVGYIAEELYESNLVRSAG